MSDRRQFTHLLGGEIHFRGPATDDDALAILAARQHGIAGRRQALELGISRRAIEHRLRMGRLRPLFLGVYAVGHEALTFPGRALAAVMSAAPGAAASHVTAAALWGIVEPPRGPTLIRVTAVERRRSRRGLAIARAALPTADVGIVAGVPVTTVPRTLLDLAGAVEPQRLHRLVKEAEFQKLVTLGELTEVLARHPRRQGRRNLARLLEPLAAPRPTQTEFEDRFLDFCAKRSLPLPETNVELTIRGRSLRPDSIWRDERLIVELDGRDAHARELAFEDDRARDRMLIAAGWAPMRVTWAQLRRDADGLEAEIRDTLANRRQSGHTGRGRIAGD